MKQWEKNEKKDAKKFGTKTQPRSGAFDFYPGDSSNSDFLVDTKTTTKKSYSISQKTWNKICEEAAFLDSKDGKTRVPLLSLHFRNQHLVVISAEDLEDLLIS